MAKPFHLRVLAMDRAFLEGECVSLTLPVTDGQLGLMAGHSPIAAAVSPGSLTARLADGTAETAVVGHGVVRFENNDALVLVESVERPEEIDVRRAAEALEAAKGELRESGTPRRRLIAAERVEREQNRLRRAKQAE